MIQHSDVTHAILAADETAAVLDPDRSFEVLKLARWRLRFGYNLPLKALRYLPELDGAFYTEGIALGDGGAQFTHCWIDDGNGNLLDPIMAQWRRWPIAYIVANRYTYSEAIYHASSGGLPVNMGYTPGMAMAQKMAAELADSLTITPPRRATKVFLLHEGFPREKVLAMLEEMGYETTSYQGVRTGDTQEINDAIIAG
jgi:hypothetical protein